MADSTFYVTLRRRVTIKKWVHYDKPRYLILIPNGKGGLQQYAQTYNPKAAITCAHKADERYCSSPANPAS